MNDRYTVRNGKIVTPNAIIENDIYICDGIIAGIGKNLSSENSAIEIDAQNSYILPGFRDQHMHHIFGQLTAGEADTQDAARKISEVAKAKAREGVTNFWLALFGGPVRQMEAYLEGIKSYMDSSENGRAGATLLGGFIEGTFLNTDCRGAQLLENIFRPDAFISPEVRNQADGKSPLNFCRYVLDVLHDTGSLKFVNIVPDYGEPSYTLIEYAAQKGIVVGMGHTNCHARDIRIAMDRGLSFFVHFTNGPTGHNTKSFGGGGAYEGGVTLPIVKEFILDGFHVDYRVVLDVIKSSIEVHDQSLENFILVTDQSFPIKSEISEDTFTIGTTHARASMEKGFIEVVGYERDGKIVAPPPNTLCGSLSTMDKNFSNYLSIRTRDIKGIHAMHKAVPLSQAVIEGAKLCAGNQAQFIGNFKTGVIEKGRRADIVIGKISGTDGNYDFSVKKVFVKGIDVLRIGIDGGSDIPAT